MGQGLQCQCSTEEEEITYLPTLDMEIRALVFDFGGVLAPKDGRKFEIDGVDLKSKQKWKQFWKAGLIGKSDESFEEFFEDLVTDCGLEKQKAEQYREKLESEYFVEKYNMCDLLMALQKQDYLLAIVANHIEPLFKRIMNFYCYDSVFEEKNVHLSCAIGVEKPNKELWFRCYDTLSRTGQVVYPRECLYIDSNKQHLEEARKAGFQVLLWDNEKEDIQVLKDRLQRAGVAGLAMRRIETQSSLVFQ